MSEGFSPKAKKKFLLAAVLLAVFVILTVLLYTADRQPYTTLVTPYAKGAEAQTATIGLAGLNLKMSEWLGFRNGFYEVTEVLGYVEIAVAVFIFLLAVWQLVTRKSIRRIDREVIAMMVPYALIVIFYVLFERISPNFRPVLLEEGLEMSFPSTHTVLGVGVMVTAEAFFARHFRDNTFLGKWMPWICRIISVTTVFCRAMSGVHWVTDILGGLLLAFAIAFVYDGLIEEE